MSLKTKMTLLFDHSKVNIQVLHVLKKKKKGELVMIFRFCLLQDRKPLTKRVCDLGAEINFMHKNLI